MKRWLQSGGVAILAMLLGFAGLSLSGAFSESSAPESLSQRPARSVSSSGDSEPTPSQAQPVLPSPAARALNAAVAARSSELAPDAARQPHAISPRHRRIFEENSRIGAMNGALDQGDFAALRRMAAQYRADYPEDEHDLQEGYDLIADCLEERTPMVVEAAQRYWHTHRASMLRRHVRRHCLENRAGDGAAPRHASQ